jgi:hypothetical protein
MGASARAADVDEVLPLSDCFSLLLSKDEPVRREFSYVIHSWQTCHHGQCRGVAT